MAPLQRTHQDHQPSGRRFPLKVLAHNLQAPGNVGSLFRLADALGFEGLILSGSTPRPPSEKIRRASRSTLRWVPWESAEDPVEALKALQAQGWRLVALELTQTSQDLRTFPLAPEDRICLVLGAEDHGVPLDLLELCGTAVHIPMRGQNSSMNVADACGIAGFEIIRRAWEPQPAS